MKKFTVRVQLNGDATWDDYEKLHREMRRRGFSTLIQDAKTGKWYHLPHAEYNRVANQTKEQVARSVRDAAGTVTDDFQILVTASNGRSWYYLRPASAADVQADQSRS